MALQDEKFAELVGRVDAMESALSAAIGDYSKFMARAIGSIHDRLAALEAAMRLLEESAASRSSAQAHRIGALEAFNERFSREYSPQPTDD